MSINFIIADNQALTARGLRFIINHRFKDSEIQEVFNKKDLIEALLHKEDSIVILDYSLFNFRIVDELINTSVRFPKSHWILISNEFNDNIIRRISLEDNFSLLLKENETSIIIRAIENATNQCQYICPQLKAQISEDNNIFNTDTLTSTEIEILKLIAHGKSVKEIAGIRMSSIHTIITHKKNIFRKLEVNSVYEASKYAIKAGLVELMEYYI